MQTEQLGDSSGYGLAPIAPVTPQQNDSLVTNLLTLGSGVLSLINQQKVADANIKLAQEGKPQVQLQNIQGAVPTLNVTAGIQPATQQLLLWGGLGVLAGIFLFTQPRRRA